MQIGVYKENLQTDILTKMNALGNIEKENVNGSTLYRYNAGTYSEFTAAERRLIEVKLAGFEDAFIKAVLDGKQITIEQAKTLSE